MLIKHLAEKSPLVLLACCPPAAAINLSDELLPSGCNIGISPMEVEDRLDKLYKVMTSNSQYPPRQVLLLGTFLTETQFMGPKARNISLFLKTLLKTILTQTHITILYKDVSSLLIALYYQ